MSKRKGLGALRGGIAAIIVLILCLFVTTAAIRYSVAAVRDNTFKTGSIKIDLNGGSPVISEHEFLFEPGMTVQKDFYIKNESTCDVYYRLYFEHVSGGLADVLRITVMDGEKQIYNGTAKSLNREAIPAADDYLKIGERRNLTVLFYYPKEAGNDTGDSSLSFVLSAEAVQMLINPGMIFG